MKKAGIVTLTILVAVICAACGSADKKQAGQKNEEGTGTMRQAQNIHVACGTSTGVNYLTVTTIGALLGKEYPEYTLTPEISTGGAENIGLILNGEAQIGSAMIDDIVACNNNERKWEDTPETKDSLRYITSGNRTSITQFARKDSGIKAFSDAKGKRVAVSSGTMYNYYWPMMLEAYGLTEEDFEKVSVIGLKDILTAIQDGVVDYGVHVSSTPNASIQDTSLSVGLNILNMDDDIINKLIEINPCFMKFTIPADTYDSDFDANTVCLYNAYVTTADADQQMIYDFIKCLTENNDALKAAHSQAGDIGKLENVLANQRIPFSEGAERYYKEIGLIK